MKNILLLSLMLVGMPLAHGAKTLCPEGSTEISACVADAFIPVYPFVSICQDQSGYMIMMDAGGMSSTDTMLATRTDSDTSAMFMATESDADGVMVTIQKSGAQKVKATLSYKMLTADMNSSYTCSALSQ